jgi:arylformamidase
MKYEYDPYFEKQYNNRVAVPEHGDFIQAWVERSEGYRKRASNAVLNVSYGNQERQLLDIFPLQQSKAPVHVFIHGGYWQALSKDSFSFFAQTVNTQGECAVILNYGLCPQFSVSQITQQIFDALVWVYKNISRFGGDPDNMQLTGHSAGGHLLACMLTKNWSHCGVKHPPFRQMNALSGLYDLQPLVSTSINAALKLDLQSALENSPLYQSLWNPSPDFRLNLLVGELESDEYRRQSMELFSQWQRSFFISSQIASRTHHFSILDAFLERHYQALEMM